MAWVTFAIIWPIDCLSDWMFVSVYTDAHVWRMTELCTWQVGQHPRPFSWLGWEWASVKSGFVWSWPEQWPADMVWQCPAFTSQWSRQASRQEGSHHQASSLTSQPADQQTVISNSHRSHNHKSANIYTYNIHLLNGCSWSGLNWIRVDRYCGRRSVSVTLA